MDAVAVARRVVLPVIDEGTVGVAKFPAALDGSVPQGGGLSAGLFPSAAWRSAYPGRW